MAGLILEKKGPAPLVTELSLPDEIGPACVPSLADRGNVIGTCYGRSYR
jgi:hypothetical protein